MIHDFKKGSVLVLIVCSGTIVMFIAHVLATPAVVYTDVPGMDTLLFINTAIKSIFIIMSCYTIILVTAWREQGSQLTESLKERLEEESAFRDSVQRNVLYHYNVNIETDKVTDSKGFFVEKIYSPGDSHHDFLEKVLKIAVEPVYWEFLTGLASFDFIDKELKKSGNLNERVRMSPRGILSMINFPPEFEEEKDRLFKYQKDYIWVEISTTMMKDKETGENIIYITVSDIDEQMEKETSLIRAAKTDQLTGLLNRNASEEMIKTRMANGETGALFIMDLDGFKSVNDTLGHPRGDQVLISTAEKLRNVFRGNDVICRLGGDEFMVFCVGMDNLDIVRERAKVLNGVMCEDVSVPGGNKVIHVSASIGIARYPHDATTFEDLYKRADSALYVSKENGKNQATLYK